MEPVASYIPACDAGAVLRYSAEMKRPIQSPCINVCVIDAGTGLCAGCSRSLDEIARWAAMTDPERQRIMRELPSRHAQARKAAEA
jgi:predicted Fe-S protein YdhL (DUF1289 family)